MGKRDAEERDYDDELDNDDDFESDDMDDDAEIENALEQADLIEEWCPKCKAMTSHQVLHDGSRKIACAECNHEHLREKNVPVIIPDVVGIISKEEREDPKLRKAAWGRLTKAVPEAEIKKYSIHTDFVEGDVVSHNKFGLGVVIEKIEKTKVDVLFENEQKLLVCNK